MKHSAHFSLVICITEDAICLPTTLELWPKDVIPLMNQSVSLQCHTAEENWVKVVNGRYRYLQHADKRNDLKFTCSAQAIRWKDDYTYIISQKVPIQDGKPLLSDFSEVTCINTRGKIHRSIVTGVAPEFDREVSPGDTQYTVDNMAKQEPLNVLIIGLDSMSRLHWKRMLPHTYNFFTYNLKGVVLEGYNTVGGGTTANLLALLTGKLMQELPEGRRGFPGADTLDHYPWLWSMLKKKGYATLWGEDGARSGTFQLRMRGFKNKPVDHYMRVLYMKAEKEYHKHNPYCLGSIPRHLNMLNWMNEFVEVYKHQPKFGFIFHSEFSHTGNSQVKIMDEPIVDLLEHLNKANVLNNSILLLMSDHGARFQQLRRAKQGSIEELLPFFGIRLPAWFKKIYPQFHQQILESSKRLVFPLDIHETILHLMNLENYEDKSTHKGKSLLHGISKTRTCSDIGIKQHWCACVSWVDISISQSRVIKAAHSVVTEVNRQIEQFSSVCHAITLNRIIGAKTIAKSERSQEVDEVLKIELSVYPSNGTYEATVTMVNNVPRVSREDISRTNEYGDQPKCVEQRFPHLRPFCYCIFAE